MSSKEVIHSERSFGILFSLISICFYLHSYFIRGILNNNFLYFALALFTISIFIPKLLYYPNLIWFKLGNLLHIILSPLIMISVFLFVATPTGLFFRLFNYDPLSKSYDFSKSTYWLQRKNPKLNYSDQF